MAEVKTQICPLPWTHLFVLPDGNILPCCAWDFGDSFGNLNFASADKILNGKKYQKLRNDLSSGIIPKSCQQCYKFDKDGISSYKQRSTLLLTPILDSIAFDKSIVDPSDTRFLDIRFSNKCNLQCVMCNADASSAIHFANTGNRKITSFLNSNSSVMSFLDNVPEPILINFAGGEPLIMPEHYQTLDYYIDRGIADRISLKYNTNLTTLSWGGKSLSKYWDKFKDVTVGISLDHFGKRLEYIRFPINAASVEENLTKIKSFERTTCFVAVSVSVFNVFDLVQIYDWYTSRGLKVIMNPVYDPLDLSIRSLPHEIKESLVLKYKDLQFCDRIVSILKSSDHFSNPNFANDFNAKISFIDTQRKHKFADVFTTSFEWLKSSVQVSHLGI